MAHVQGEPDPNEIALVAMMAAAMTPGSAYTPDALAAEAWQLYRAVKQAAPKPETK